MLEYGAGDGLSMIAQNVPVISLSGSGAYRGPGANRLDDEGWRARIISTHTPRSELSYAFDP